MSILQAAVLIDGVDSSIFDRQVMRGCVKYYVGHSLELRGNCELLLYDGLYTS